MKRHQGLLVGIAGVPPSAVTAQPPSGGVARAVAATDARIEVAACGCGADSVSIPVHSVC